MTNRATSAASECALGARAVYSQKFQRNPLRTREQERVRRACFAIIGLGGTGGYMLESLLRMGAERFMVFEDDRTALSDFNRQILAVDKNIDRLKTDSARSRADMINAFAHLVIKGRFTKGSKLTEADIVLDGSDNIETKHLAAGKARTASLPYVFCSAQGTRGIVTVFNDYPFRKAFQLPNSKSSALGLERYRKCASIICPAAMIAGSLAASQAVNALLKKPHTKAPQAIFFDLARENPFWRAELG